MAYIVASYSSAVSPNLEVFFEANTDDIILLTYSDRYATYSPPSWTGWNAVSYNKTTYNGGDNAVWWKRATATGSDSVAITVSNNACWLNAHVIRWVDTINAFDVTTVSRATSNQNPLQSNQISPVTDNTLIFHHMFSDGYAGVFDANIVNASDFYKAGHSYHYSAFSYANSGDTTPVENFYFANTWTRSFTWITFAFRDDWTNKKVWYVDDSIMSSDIILPAWSLNSHGIFTGSTANVDLTSTGSNLIPTVNGYATSIPYNFGSIWWVSHWTDYRSVNCALACTSRSAAFDINNKIIAVRSKDDGMKTPYQPIGKNIIVWDWTNFRRYKIDAKDTSPSSSTLNVPILINPSALTHKEDWGTVDTTVLNNIDHFAIAGSQPNGYAGSSYDRVIALSYLPMTWGSTTFPCNLNDVVKASKIQDVKTVQAQSWMATGQFICFQSIKLTNGIIWDSTGQSIEYAWAYNETLLRTNVQINSWDLFFEIDTWTGNDFTLSTQSINMWDYHWFKLTSGNPLGSWNVVSNAKLQLEALDSWVVWYTFDSCEEIQFTTMHDFSAGNIFSNSIDAQVITLTWATQTALQALLDNLANCTFLNNAVAIRLEYTWTWNISLDFDWITFTNNTIDVHYDSTNTSALTAVMENWSNVVTTAFSGSATGITISAPSKWIEFTWLESGSFVLIVPAWEYAATAWTNKRFYKSSSSTSETYLATIEEDVDISILHPDYDPIYITSYTVWATQSNYPVQQKEDRAANTDYWPLVYGTNYSISGSVIDVSESATVQQTYNYTKAIWALETLQAAALANIPLPLSSNGTSSFSLNSSSLLTWSFSAGSFNYLHRDWLRYFDEVTGTTTDVWAAVWSSWETTWMTAEYQQVANWTVTNVLASGDIDQLIKIFDNWVFDYTGHLKIKYQVAGYDEAYADLSSIFGTLADELYVVNLEPTANWVTASDTWALSIAITQHAPTTWNWKDYSITIQDNWGYTWEQIRQYINWNLAQDGSFDSIDVFNWSDMVFDDGSDFRTQRIDILWTWTNKWVRVVQSDWTTAHADFSRFMSDDWTYYTVPVVISRWLAFTWLVAGSFVKVFETWTDTEKFSTLSSWITETWNEEVSGSITIDYVIMQAGYLPIRVTWIEVTGSESGSTSTPISQLWDRAYVVSSWLTINTNVFATPWVSFKLTTASTVQNFYSYMIEQWIALWDEWEALANKPFTITTNWPNSFTFIDWVEWSDWDTSIAFLSRDGLRYTDGWTTTATWSAIQSVWEAFNQQSRFQQQDWTWTTNANNTDKIDQLIQVYWDVTHWNFDYTDHLVVEIQADWYDQVREDVYWQYGTLEDQLYVIWLSPSSNGLTTWDPSVTWLTITDHWASPVTWNWKDFGITITDSATAHTWEEIMRWLRYNIWQGGTFQWVDAFNWHDLVQISWNKFKTVNGVIDWTTWTPIKWVRVVLSDWTTPHPDFNLFTADNGSTYEPPVSVTISNANLIDWTRVQLYNVTQANELDNSIVSWWSWYSYINNLWSWLDLEDGDSIRIRATYTNGVTAKLWIESLWIVTAGWLTFLDSQSDDTVYISYALDGSTITKFTADYTDTEVDISSAVNFTAKEAYAWFIYNTTTSLWIAAFFGWVTAIDAWNLRINNTVVNIFWDNITSTNVWQTDIIRIFREDWVRPVKNSGVTTWWGWIDIRWQADVFVTTVTWANVITWDIGDLPTASENAAAVWGKDVSGYITDDWSAWYELQQGWSWWLDESELHTALDNYENKDQWMWRWNWWSSSWGISIVELNTALEYMIGKVEAISKESIKDINSNTWEVWSEIYTNIWDDLDKWISKMKDVLETVKTWIENIKQQKESWINEKDLLKNLDEIKWYVSKTPLKDDIIYIRNQIDTYKEVDVELLTKSIWEQLNKYSWDLEKQIISNFDSKLLKVSDDMKLLQEWNKIDTAEKTKVMDEFKELLNIVSWDKFEKAYDKLDQLWKKLVDLNNVVMDN